MTMVDLTEATFVDKRVGAGIKYGDTDPIIDSENYHSILTLKARLQTINAAYYTNARLNTMNKNDMVYALRLVGSDLSGV